MPTVLGPPRDLAKRRPYPHILEEDWHVMDRFLDKYAHIFDTAYYNVRVGGPEPGKSHDHPKWDEVWRQLKQYRVDVILVKKNELWICEVTTTAGPRAIGQALVYTTAYLKDPVLGTNAKPTIICQYADEDITETARIQDIQIIQT